MRVDRLEIENFRAWPRALLEPDAGKNLLLGRNGSGKSSLLEALHLCALGFSPRTRREPEMVRWGADRFYARIEGAARQGAIQLAASCDLQGRKETRIQGEAGRLFSQLMGRLAVVGLYPEDLDLVRGGPAVRRTFLDSLACQLDPYAVEEFRRYARVLKQRNALLKDPARYGAEARETLDAQWLDAALPVLFRRIGLAGRLDPLVRSAYAAVSGGAEVASLAYEGSYGDLLPAVVAAPLDLRPLLEARLTRLSVAELSAGAALFGPHRDDLRLELDMRPARASASQGQARSFAVALRLASAALLEELRGEPPVLLLDDVFAELDAPRRERLAALLPRHAQSFLCSPHRGDLPFEVDRTFLLVDGEARIA